MIDLASLEQKNGLPDGILSAMMQQESSGDPNAISPKGATGAFQFMPQTAQEYGIDPTNPDQSAQAAAKMMGGLVQKYSGDIPSALAGYNWGQGNVDRHGLQNAPPETQGYIQNIMGKIGNMVVPSAKAADYSTMSDQDLLNIAKQQGIQPNAYGNMSNEDLMAEAKKQGLSSGSIVDRAKPYISEAGRQLGLTGRYLAEGAMAIPNAVGDATNTAINAFLPDQYKLGMPSQSTSNLLTQAGVPQPHGALENIIGGAGRALASTGATMKAAETLTPEIPAIAPLAQNPAFQGRAAMGAGGASAAAKEMGFGPIGQTVAGLAGGGLTTRGMTSEQPSLAANLRSQSSQLYQDAAEMGGVLSPEFTNSFLADAKNSVSEPESVTRAFGNTPVQKIVEGLQEEYAGKPINLDEAQAIDQRLGQAIDGQILPTGKPNAVGKQLLDMQTKFRDAIDNISPEDVVGGKDGFSALQQARQLWAQSARARDIENIMQRADMMEQPATALRSGFRTLYNNPSRMRGFTPDQKELIKNAATLSMPVEVLRGLGSRLIGVISAGTGHLGESIAMQGMSKVSRDMATQMQMNRAQKILDSIGGAPKKSMMPGLPYAAGAVQGVIPEVQQ